MQKNLGETPREEKIETDTGLTSSSTPEKPKITTEPFETQEVREREIEETREELKKANSLKPEQPAPEIDKPDKAKIKKYQDRYLPDYIRNRGFISKTITRLWEGLIKSEKEGEENIPKTGPFVVICNHFGGGDAETLSSAFKDTNLHLAIAKETWWNKSPILRWAFKGLGMIPIEESLSNLTEAEKEEALDRQEKNSKQVFRKIIDKEKQGGVAKNVEFIRQSVAALSRGESIGIFPEGLWLNPQGPLKSREKAEMKKGYAGIELLANQYKKLTGQELPIIPTSFIEDPKTGKKKLVISKPLLLSKNTSGMNDTDWCMAYVAKSLPENQRGYYKEAADKIADK